MGGKGKKSSGFSMASIGEPAVTFPIRGIFVTDFNSGCREGALGDSLEDSEDKIIIPRVVDLSFRMNPFFSS